MNRNNWLLALVAVPVLPPLVLVAQGCFNPADTCLALLTVLDRARMENRC